MNNFWFESLVEKKDNLKNSSKVLFRCCCGNTGLKSVGHAKRSFKEKGFSFQCKQCLAKKISKAKGIFYNSDFLLKVGVVNTEGRVIQSQEKVEFKCRCGSYGLRKWTDAQKTNKLYGFYFQCRSCRAENIKKRSNNLTWLENLRKASKTQAHKDRAVINGKKRLFLKKIKNVLDFWDFKNQNIQMIPGYEKIGAFCKKCNIYSVKQFKKFIEATASKSHGCSQCWLNIYKSKEFSGFMSTISKLFWDSNDSIDLKIKLKEKSQELFLAYKKWVKENPEKAFTSKSEEEVREWISSFGFKCDKLNDEYKYEIDVFVEKLKLGIEYNGLYWHSELHKNKDYHINKTNFFKKHDIKIIHIFDHQWRFRKEQVKSYLKSALGINKNKIGARKCDIKIVSYNDACVFLEKYHIQGKTKNISFCIGLYNKEELLGLATFGKHHRNNKQIVMNRFVCKEDWTISGGLSRLSKYASDYFKQDIITWADNSISEGNGYISSGWELEEILKPDYFYTDGKRAFSKQSRKKSIVGTPEDITESEHAILDGLFKVYDCGKTRFVYKYKPE